MRFDDMMNDYPWGYPFQHVYNYYNADRHFNRGVTALYRETRKKQEEEERKRQKLIRRYYTPWP